jgi:hypothetical protein
MGFPLVGFTSGRSSPRLMGMNISKYPFYITLGLSLFSFHWAQAETAPSWFDVKAHSRLVQAKAKSDGLVRKADLEKFESKKFEVGAHKLTLVIARFGGGNSEAGGGYNVSEIFAEPLQSSKPLFQLIDKSGCESKVVDEVTSKKLGFNGDTVINFLQVKLVPPSCPNSEINSPKVFMVIQEKKASLEKVFESAIADNGKYNISFQKDMIRLDYTKGLKGQDTKVELVWDDKTSRFTEPTP